MPKARGPELSVSGEVKTIVAQQMGMKPFNSLLLTLDVIELAI